MGFLRKCEVGQHPSLTRLITVTFAAIMVLTVSCSRQSPKAGAQKKESYTSIRQSGVGQGHDEELAEYDESVPLAGTKESIVAMLQDTALDCSASQTLVFDGLKWLCADPPRNLTAIAQDESVEQGFITIGADGDVTVGMTEDSARLRLNGGLIIGNTETCQEDFTGMLRINVDGVIEQCHDGQWGDVALGGATIGSASSQAKVARYEPLLIVDEKPSGSVSGSFNNGAWRVRDLNTVRHDIGDNVVSLIDNEVTLKAGMYNCDMHAGAYQVEHHQLRLFNVTAGEVEAYGTIDHSEDSEWNGNRAFVSAVLELNAPTTFRIEHRANRSRVSNGFGVSSVTSWEAPSVYAIFNCVRFR